nr:transporter substrate-binding domain-containing protein [uncultured Undibacterium sp.]
MALLKHLLITASLLCLSTQTFAQNKTQPILSLYCEDDKPLQFYDDNKKLTGLTVEVVQEIQRRIGNTDRIQVVPWSRGIDKLNTVPNSFLFTMARTPDREHLYQWIGPILSIEYGLYVRADSKIQIHKLEDAKKGVPITASLAGYKATDVKLAYDLFKTPLYIAVSKSTEPAIVAQWNSTLDEMKKDKTFLKLLKKYNEE